MQADTAPLENAPPEEIPEPGAPEEAPVAPPSRRKAIYAVVGAAAAVAVIATVLLAGVGGLGHPAKAQPQVHLTAVDLSFQPGDNPCFGTDYANHTPSTLAAGGQLTFNVALKDLASYQARACTVGKINISTPGFTLASANVPLKVRNAGTTVLTIVINLPNVAYNGSLVLSAPVTYLQPDIKVQGHNVTFVPSSNPCGTLSPFGGGFTAFSGDRYNDSVGVIDISPQKYCSVSSVSVATSGFSVVSANTPVSLPINNLASVNFVLQLPSAPYSGNVSVSLSLSWS